jgi:hypothetical protein
LCLGLLGDLLHELLDLPVLPYPLLLPELVALWARGYWLKTELFGYSGPMWDLSYLVSLVAPVGSATESEELVPLSEDSESDPFWSPLTVSVSL